MTELIYRVAPATVTEDMTLELLTDVARALESVARDFLPAGYTVNVQRSPTAAVLRIPGHADAVVEAALGELVEAVKAVTDAALPVLPLRFAVIIAEVASGIEVTPLQEPARYPTFHRIYKRDVKLQLSDYSRSRRN